MFQRQYLIVCLKKTHINIDNINKNYLNGCFEPDDYEKYLFLEEIIRSKGYAYITIEKSKGRFVKIFTIKITEVRAVRGSAFFIYEDEIGKHLVFEYHQEENIRIGVDPEQNPYTLEYYNYPKYVSYEELYEMTER